MIKKIIAAAGLGLGAYLIYEKFAERGIETANGEGGFLKTALNKVLGVGDALTPVVNNMSISLRGLAHIKGWEGFEPRVYLDAAGLPTIGYGHLIKPNESFDVITEAKASQLLAKDVTSAESAVNRGVKVAITQNQFDALVSFAFNVGNGGFLTSTMLKRINAGQLSEAANEFGRWVFVTKKGVKEVDKGLVNRRVADYNLFRGVA